MLDSSRYCHHHGVLAPLKAFGPSSVTYLGADAHAFKAPWTIIASIIAVIAATKRLLDAARETEESDKGSPFLLFPLTHRQA